MTRTEEILATLVAFPTVSSASNLALIDWVGALLERAGFDVHLIPSDCGQKAGLLARFGAGAGGVLLSAHSDVVPVEGQDWTTDPFTLRRMGDRLYGRGTTDMKGFLASVLALAEGLHDAPPARPVMIALSWDEEVGCLGIRQMLDRVIPVLGLPDLCIVGEPSSMRLAVGHKGKAAYRAVCTGQPGHSAMAPRFVNALHLAADLIGALRAEQAWLLSSGAQDTAYDVACSTVHAGRMSGGIALNMVPAEAEVAFEIRHLASETSTEILNRIKAGLPEGIEITQTNAYPGLEADASHPEVAALAPLLGNGAPVKVSYGTEAGYFAALGIPTMVCGPGDMAQGHQPDEFIEAAELTHCDRFLARLVAMARP